MITSTAAVLTPAPPVRRANPTERTTGIAWTDYTWNPWIGCTKVSPGCKYCYMYRDRNRYGYSQEAIKTVQRTSSSTFNKPLTYKGPALIFTCSWSDFFIETADEWREEAWSIIRKTPHLTYQILTKRPENIADRLPPDWEAGYPNVWLGVSVETADYFWRIDRLREYPAAVRFISYEPALQAVDFSRHLEGIKWLVSGGESGDKARPASLDWFRAVRDQCQHAGIAYFHKQHGGQHKVGGEYGGRLLDGRLWDNLPEPPAEPPPPPHGWPRLADVPESPGDTPQTFFGRKKKSNEETQFPAAVEAWTPSGKRLLVSASSPEHAAAIRRLNPPPQGDNANDRDGYEERAAIMEYDAGLPRTQAELAAATCRYCRHWSGTRSGSGWCVVAMPAVPRNAADTCEQFQAGEGKS